MKNPEPVYQYKGMTILFPILTEDSVGILCGQWKRKEGVWWEVQGRKCHYAGIEYLGLGDLCQDGYRPYRLNIFIEGTPYMLRKIKHVYS